MTLRWRLTSRSKQRWPDEHILCESPEHCHEVIAEAKVRYPYKRQKDDRLLYELERGHVPWFIWLILAGRGWGKTRTGAENVAQEMLNRPHLRVALIAPTFADGRDTMVEGESGLLQVIPPSLILDWNRSLGELILTNGSRAKIFSSETPKRLRGPQHHLAWCDELAAWEYLKATWDMMMFGLRLGDYPKVIITTTPKPLKFLRAMLVQAKDSRNGIVYRTGRFRENRRHLPRQVMDRLEDTFGGTRMGRQELDAEVLDDLGGGIIRLEDIEEARLEQWQVTTATDDADVPGRSIAGLLARITVNVDPAVTDKATSDECGITVTGKTVKPCPFCSTDRNALGRAHAVVLEDQSGIMSVETWARRAAALYKKWRADAIVAEVNNGGDLVEANIRGAEPGCRVVQVRASRGKVKRAEPVAALYEKHMVHHFQVTGSQDFGRMEDQLCSYGIETDEDADPDTDESSSPDRGDSVVWGLTELMIPKVEPVQVYNAVDTRGTRTPQQESMAKALARVKAKAGITNGGPRRGRGRR